MTACFSCYPSTASVLYSLNGKPAGTCQYGVSLVNTPRNDHGPTYITSLADLAGRTHLGSTTACKFKAAARVAPRCQRPTLRCDTAMFKHKSLNVGMINHQQGSADAADAARSHAACSCTCWPNVFVVALRDVVIVLEQDLQPQANGDESIPLPPHHCRQRPCHQHPSGCLSASMQPPLKARPRPSKRRLGRCWPACTRERCRRTAASTAAASASAPGTAEATQPLHVKGSRESAGAST